MEEEDDTEEGVRTMYVCMYGVRSTEYVGRYVSTVAVSVVSREGQGKGREGKEERPGNQARGSQASAVRGRFDDNLVQFAAAHQTSEKQAHQTSGHHTGARVPPRYLPMRREGAQATDGTEETDGPLAGQLACVTGLLDGRMAGRAGTCVVPCLGGARAQSRDGYRISSLRLQSSNGPPPVHGCSMAAP